MLNLSQGSITPAPRAASRAQPGQIAAHAGPMPG
jgi:hypothetical protein